MTRNWRRRWMACPTARSSSEGRSWLPSITYARSARALEPSQWTNSVTGSPSRGITLWLYARTAALSTLYAQPASRGAAMRVQKGLSFIRQGQSRLMESIVQVGRRDLASPAGTGLHSPSGCLKADRSKDPDPVFESGPSPEGVIGKHTFARICRRCQLVTDQSPRRVDRL